MTSLAIYSAVARAGLPGLARHLRNAAPVFCFHNVVAEPGAGTAGDPGLHIGADAFGAYAAWMRRAYTVVPLGELHRRIAGGESMRGLAAITFDDAYRGVLQYALPVLRSLGLPSTLFVVSGAADAPAPFWWDVLAEGRPLDPARRDEYLHGMAGDGRAILQGRPPATLPDAWLPASWEQLRACRGELVAFGGHTVTHRNLAALDAAAARAELAGSRDAIERELGTRPRTLAYPYGLWSEATAEAARGEGYELAVTMAYGLAGHGRHAFGIPRVNVPRGIARVTLESWAAGIRGPGRPPAGKVTMAGAGPG